MWHGGGGHRKIVHRCIHTRTPAQAHAYAHECTHARPNTRTLTPSGCTAAAAVRSHAPLRRGGLWCVFGSDKIYRSESSSTHARERERELRVPVCVCLSVCDCSRAHFLCAHTHSRPCIAPRRSRSQSQNTSACVRVRVSACLCLPVCTRAQVCALAFRDAFERASMPTLTYSHTCDCTSTLLHINDRSLQAWSMYQTRPVEAIVSKTYHKPAVAMREPCSLS